MIAFKKLYNFLYDRLVFNYFHYKTKKRLEPIQHLLKGKVLDIGCGEMPYKNSFKHIETYHGTNSASYYSTSKLPKATEHIVDDGCNLPFKDACFDGVLNFQVLPVFNNMNSFYTEVSRILKPGGYFLLSSDFMYPLWNAPYNFWRTTRYGLMELAEQNNYSLEFVSDYGGYWAMEARVFPRFIRGLLYKFVLSFKNEQNLFLRLLKLIRLGIWTPISLVMPLFLNPLILLFHWLDKIMSDTDFTTNYLVLMRKKTQA